MSCHRAGASRKPSPYLFLKNTVKLGKKDCKQLNHYEHSLHNPRCYLITNANYTSGKNISLDCYFSNSRKSKQKKIIITFSQNKNDEFPQ